MYAYNFTLPNFRTSSPTGCEGFGWSANCELSKGRALVWSSLSLPQRRICGYENWCMLWRAWERSSFSFVLWWVWVAEPNVVCKTSFLQYILMKKISSRERWAHESVNVLIYYQISLSGIILSEKYIGKISAYRLKAVCLMMSLWLNNSWGWTSFREKNMD
jgi:hypothetical protein